jgi:hypothetical protein
LQICYVHAVIVHSQISDERNPAPFYRV